MVLFEGLIGLGIAFLLAPAIAEYAKVRKKAIKGFNWLAMSGVFFLFAGAFTTTLFGPGAWLESIELLGPIFEVIAWILALIGTIFVAYEVLVE